MKKPSIWYVAQVPYLFVNRMALSKVESSSPSQGPVLSDLGI